MREINDVPNQPAVFQLIRDGNFVRKEDPMAVISRLDGSYIDDESRELCRQLCR